MPIVQGHWTQGASLLFSRTCIFNNRLRDMAFRV
jgi:hypothetical protein